MGFTQPIPMKDSNDNDAAMAISSIVRKLLWLLAPYQQNKANSMASAWFACVLHKSYFHYLVPIFFQLTGNKEAADRLLKKYTTF